MSLLPRTVAAAPSEYYFALDGAAGAPQVLSQTGNTVSLSGGGGSINVASTTAVASATQKLTAQTYQTGFNSTTFSGLVRSEGNIISEPLLGQGTAELNGGLAEVRVSASDPAANPKVRFQKFPAADATIEYDASAGAWAFTPALPIPATPDLAAVLAAGEDASGAGIENLGTVVMAGASPQIRYDATPVSQTISNIAPGFANFWFLTVSSTTGFASGQACNVVGIDAVDGSLNPIVPSPFNTIGGAGYTATVQNVIAPNTIWISYNGVGAPNPPGPPTPVLTGAAQITQDSYKTLISASPSGITLKVGDGRIMAQNQFMYLRPDLTQGDAFSCESGATSRATVGSGSNQAAQFRLAAQNGSMVDYVDPLSLITTTKVNMTNGLYRIEMNNLSGTNASAIVMNQSAASVALESSTMSATLSSTGLNVNGPSAVVRVSGDFRAEGVAPSVEFYNSGAVQKAALDYVESGDKITLSAATGEVALDAAGSLTLATDVDLVLDGAALQSAAAGGSSGQHLRIKLNGTYYKIELRNDV